MQQGSSAAALTVINTRDILLQSMAAELAKEAHVRHQVWLGCHSSLFNKSQNKSRRCIHCSVRALETPGSRPCCYEQQRSCPHSLPRMQEVTALRAQMAVLGAAALQRQGFLDAAQEILLQYRGSAGSSAAAVTAEAELSIALTQARWPLTPVPCARHDRLSLLSAIARRILCTHNGSENIHSASPHLTQTHLQHLKQTLCMLQAEHSQSNISRQHLEQRLTAFQATPLAHTEKGGVQRRSVLEARAQRFLHPRDVKVCHEPAGHLGASP